MSLLSDLETTRDETLRYFGLGEADLARTYAPGKWSVRYLLLHLADSESVFLYRLRRVISEAHQVIWFYDQDAWAQALDYSSMPLDLMRNVYAAARAAIMHDASRHYEKDGHREFVHSTDGRRTLKDEFEKVAWHNAHHLEQVRAALSRSPS